MRLYSVVMIRIKQIKAIKISMGIKNSPSHCCEGLLRLSF